MQASALFFAYFLFGFRGKTK